MKKILFGSCLMMLGLVAVADTGAEVAAAKKAIKTFAGELQMELKTAMKAGGPVAAIAVCNAKAPAIAERISSEQGMQLSRVSLKNRNPDNTPSPWQSEVLEDFESKQAAGADITQLSWTETVEVSGGREFRFMKAIPTGEICVNCHGEEQAPEVSQILQELYPDDKATGYSVGDIRGAFVVTKVIGG